MNERQPHPVCEDDFGGPAFGGPTRSRFPNIMQLVGSPRLTALATALALVAGVLSSAPAQARTSSKTYKTGAVALGALGAYYLSKGKTVQGAAAVGGGYLAYKKGQKVANQERYGRTDYPRYGSNPNYGRNYGNGDYGYGGTNPGNGGYGYGGANSNVYPGSGGYNNSGSDYNNQNQNSGYRGNADLRPQRGNNGHHLGQYKHGRGGDKRDRENDDN